MVFLFLDADVRDELRGDVAAEVLAVRPGEAFFDVLERPDFAVREPPLAVLLRPAAVVLDRADVVLRDEDDRELPAFDPEREDAPLLLPRLDAPDLLRDEEPPRLLPALLLDVLLLRPELLRPPLVLFFDDEPLEERFALVAAAPFLPAALFLAVVVREEPLDERELELFELPPDERELDVDFFDPEPVERELADDLFEPPLEERELELDFFEPPLEDLEEPAELFFEPPLLLLPELDDERDPVDFLVVAMRFIPPICLCVSARATVSKNCALCYLYQMQTTVYVGRSVRLECVESLVGNFFFVELASKDIVNGKVLVL